MSTFNAEDFMNSAITSANSTKVTPVPMGEYFGIIKSVEPRTWQSKDGTKSGVSLDVLWFIEDDNVKQLLGRTEVTCKQNIMLDLTPEGKLEDGAGKNVGLGRLRAAVGKNNPGEAFSLSMLPGLSARVQVAHRADDRPTAEPGDVFSEVKAAFAMA